jgi:hypothetical protein
MGLMKNQKNKGPNKGKVKTEKQKTKITKKGLKRIKIQS